MTFSKDFKEWALWSTIGTVLIELMVWYVFQPSRLSTPHAMVAWLVLPYPSAVYAVFIVSRPSERKA